MSKSSIDINMLKTLINKYNPTTASLNFNYLYNKGSKYRNIETWEQKIIVSYCPEEIHNLKKVLICDCDGILTDGNLGYFNFGKGYKSYGCHDHEMIKLLKACGWEICFVTNDESGYNITKNRVKDLGCNVILASPIDRKKTVEAYSDDGYIVAFFGDSPSDLSAAMKADYRYTTANCFNPIKEYFHYVSKSEGGHGGFAECAYQLIVTLCEQYRNIIPA
jgi:3-deoxy-D-manno-octulosonate 8-phosphate phosphatase (KDO 8-P phosphatase)